jgi:hypothetical protein
MRQRERVFLLMYGIGTMVLAGALGIRGESQDPTVILGSTGASCTVAALGLFRTNRTEAVPSRRWIWGILLIVLLEWAVLFTHFPDVNLDDAKDALLALPGLILFSAVALLFLGARPIHSQGARRMALARIMIGSMAAGAVLILLSLLVETTERAAGWQIVAQKARWITDEYDLARVLPDTFPGSWVQGFYAVGGCAVYLLAILQAIMVAGALVSCRAQPRTLSRSPWLPWLAAASCFTTFYLYNDIYWGWLAVLMDRSEVDWSTWCGLALEFGALLGVLFAVIAALRRKDGWRSLSRLQVAQLAIAGFNFMMMANYFQRGAIYLPGLGFLMIGSQLLTWSCLGALIFGESEKAPEGVRPEQETKAAFMCR